MIPKKFHRIWLGARQRPARYDEYWQKWQELHPDWEFNTWTEENLPPLTNQWAFDSVTETARSCGVQMSHERAVAVMQADIAAYELVNKFGGVYLNCDMYPLKSFDSLLHNNSFLGMEDEYHVCNAVMGAEPGARIFRATIAQLNSSLVQYGKVGMEVATGPQHLTRVWRAGNYATQVYPKDTFYPVHHEEIPYGSDNFDDLIAKGAAKDAFAVHLWGHRSQEGQLFS